MEALWGAIYARLTSLDLWRGNAPPDYTGSPAGSPYIIGSIALSETGDGITQTATLTLDGHTYGEESALVALTEAMADAHDLLVTWRVQDTHLAAGSGSTWSLETLQPVEEADLKARRLRAVYTATYVPQRVADAHDS